MECSACGIMQKRTRTYLTGKCEYRQACLTMWSRLCLVKAGYGIDTTFQRKVFTQIKEIGSERNTLRALSGRSDETRTRGLMDPNHARYQTALHPDNIFILSNLPPLVKGFLRISPGSN